MKMQVELDKVLNLVVMGSSPTVGGKMYVKNVDILL